MARRTKKSHDTNSYWHWLVVAVFCSFFIFFIYNTMVHFARAAEVFKVKEVVLSPSLKFMESGVLSRLKGRNIFEIDLELVQRRLQTEYPQVDQLRVYRRLPDRIYIMARKRDLFALLAVSGRDIPVDENGVVLPAAMDADLKIPLIRGVSVQKIPGPGQRFSNREIPVALLILRLFRENDRLKPYEIISIDVENLSRITLVLSNDLKVLLDRDGVAQKVRMLGVMLSQESIKIDEVDYVDLRFKEPILGKKSQSGKKP